MVKEVICKKTRLANTRNDQKWSSIRYQKVQIARYITTCEETVKHANRTSHNTQIYVYKSMYDNNLCFHLINNFSHSANLDKHNRSKPKSATFGIIVL